MQRTSQDLLEFIWMLAIVVYKMVKLQNTMISENATYECDDDLIHKVVKSLPQEIDDIGKRKWDVVLVNQYLFELREATKLGRKERRHKEAQAVLAAATVATAVSLRNSSFRKDALDESAHQETTPSKLSPLAGRAGLCSQLMTRAKEFLSNLAAPQVGDCYRSIKDSTCPWYCELCEEFLSSRSFGAAAVNSWE
ncbi:Low affinity vacuolar monovalent cation/H(+) antiporter like [Actinidia chinensis var. chinensis]|uniref:Low affinity vacuolar monovalent cation/H(+) antiporter like n=1 Tax=Actinidia chinensis var. chinensis TaxID=1590841 RepID=A0A2R6QW93_ACTCC|nr:Low affinity vacuolar monovalent cation/H(+) antiporter like [Actinidia chinensis var. chinensis]